jgi:hypothetical protein
MSSLHARTDQVFFYRPGILVAKGSLNDNDKMASIQKLKVDPTAGGHLKLLQDAESSSWA